MRSSLFVCFISSLWLYYTPLMRIRQAFFKTFFGLINRPEQNKKPSRAKPRSAFLIFREANYRNAVYIAK